MSSDQYFSYIQDENKFYNILNPDRKEGDMCQTGASTFHCHWEYMEIRTTQLGFYLDKEVFIVQGLWHSLDHVPLWSTISGFPYYNLNHPPPPSSETRGLPLSVTLGRTGQFLKLEPWQSSPVPSVWFIIGHPISD